MCMLSSLSIKSKLYTNMHLYVDISVTGNVCNQGFHVIHEI